MHFKNKFTGRTLGLILIALVSFKSPAADTRDPWLWPFSSESIWNMPIGSEAKFVPAGLEKARHTDVDTELIFKVSPEAPKRTVFQPKSWESRAGGTKPHGEIPIDDNVVVEDARKGWTPNNCAAFLMPDGKTLKHVAPLCRPEPKAPVFGYYFRPDNDIYGDGIRGSHGGSGMSAIGGSVRLGELVNAQPIKHALKVDIYCKKYAYYGEDRKGFRWPADRADSYAAKEYRGSNKSVVIGSLLALPPTIKIEELGLKTEVARKLAQAFQDYGAYIVDDAAWDCHYLCAESGVNDEVQKKYGHKLNSEWKEYIDDINQIFTKLEVVENNAENAIGGGGVPRCPKAPPLRAP